MRRIGDRILAGLAVLPRSMYLEQTVEFNRLFQIDRRSSTVCSTTVALSSNSLLFLHMTAKFAEMKEVIRHFKRPHMETDVGGNSNRDGGNPIMILTVHFARGASRPLDG